MCTIDVDTFYSFTKNIWIGDSHASCHITYDDTSKYVITNIDESIHGSMDIMPTNPHVNVWQVDGTEWVHTLCPMKFCLKVGANHWSNTVVNSTGKIILGCSIKTCNGLLTGVEFIQETHHERAQWATAPHKKNIINLHVELRHPSKTITHATTKALGSQVTGIDNLCEGFSSGKAKQHAISEKVVPHLKILGERLFST